MAELGPEKAAVRVPSADVWLGEIAFNTRTLRGGDGATVFPGTEFGRPGGSGGGITIENLTVQAGVLVADESGLQQLGYRIARYVDQAIGGEIAIRDRLNTNVNTR
jgi:hypothetical protein